MTDLFKTRFRIVSDRFAGYEAQGKPWWSPVWIQLGYGVGSWIGVNTHSSPEKAREFIERWRNHPHSYMEYVA